VHLKPIYEYLDYQEFLKDFYEDKKSGNFFFSYQYIGQRVQMDPSYIAKVLSGQRHIPVNKILTFVELCNLEGKQQEYFENLVYFCRAKTDKETKLYYENLIRLRSVKGITVSSSQYKFYSKWHYTAIRAILGLKNYVDEYEEIAKKLDPPLRPEQVRQAITFMLRTEIIKKNTKGFLEPTWKHISSGLAGDKVAIRNFQKEMLHLAERSLEAHPKEVRDISTLTIAIKSECIPDIQRIIADAREAIRQRIDLDKDPDTIYQLNLQLFPLTQVQK
jgi:uncharacterized protein (TIGR02147 family)